MEKLLLRFPEAEALRSTRRPAAGLATENLTANADVVHRIAPGRTTGPGARIEGEEAGWRLLAAVNSA